MLQLDSLCKKSLTPRITMACSLLPAPCSLSSKLIGFLAAALLVFCHSALLASEVEAFKGAIDDLGAENLEGFKAFTGSLKGPERDRYLQLLQIQFSLNQGSGDRREAKRASKKINKDASRDQALQALQELRTMILDEPLKSDSLNACAGEVYLNASDFNKAAYYLKQALDGKTLSNSDRIVTTLSMVEVHLSTGDFAEAAKVLKQAQYQLNDADRYNEWGGLRNRVNKLRWITEQLCEIRDHGIGFPLYKKAQDLRLNKHDYQSALEQYQKIISLEGGKKTDVADLLAQLYRRPSIDSAVAEESLVYPVYVEASGFHSIACLYELGQTKEAIAQAVAFIQENPTGLYRCEAALLLADIYLEGSGDMALAEKRYSDAIILAKKAQKKRLDSARFMPNKTKKITAPPARMKYTDKWGNINWATLKSDDIFNRTTADWYLPFVLCRATLRRALCRYAIKDVDGAIADLEASLKYDPIDARMARQGYFSNFLRLRDGFKTGRMYATAEELGAFSGVVKSRLLLAELMFETEQWPQAVEKYRKIRLALKGNMNPRQEAYLVFAESSALLMGGDERGAKKLMDHLLSSESFTTIAGSVTWGRALMMRAGIMGDMNKRIELLARSYPQVRDKETLMSMLVQLISYLKNTEHTKIMDKQVALLSSLISQKTDIYFQSFLNNLKNNNTSDADSHN